MTYDDAMDAATRSVRRVMTEQGRINLTKADFEMHCMIAAALCDAAVKRDDNEIERRAFRAKVAR